MAFPIISREGTDRTLTLSGFIIHTSSFKYGSEKEKEKECSKGRQWAARFMRLKRWGGDAIPNNTDDFPRGPPHSVPLWPGFRLRGERR